MTQHNWLHNQQTYRPTGMQGGNIVEVTPNDPIWDTVSQIGATAAASQAELSTAVAPSDEIATTQGDTGPETSYL